MGTLPAFLKDVMGHITMNPHTEEKLEILFA